MPPLPGSANPAWLDGQIAELQAYAADPAPDFHLDGYAERRGWVYESDQAQTESDALLGAPSVPDGSAEEAGRAHVLAESGLSEAELDVVLRASFSTGESIPDDTLQAVHAAIGRIASDTTSDRSPEAANDAALLLRCLPPFNPDRDQWLADQLFAVPVEDSRYVALRAVQWVAWGHALDNDEHCDNGGHVRKSTHEFDWQANPATLALSQHGDPAVRTMFVMALCANPDNDVASVDVGGSNRVSAEALDTDDGNEDYIDRYHSAAYMDHRIAAWQTMRADPDGAVQQMLQILRSTAWCGPWEDDRADPDETNEELTPWPEECWGDAPGSMSHMYDFD